jgi:dienelactone hydrolase
VRRVLPVVLVAAIAAAGCSSARKDTAVWRQSRPAPSNAAQANVPPVALAGHAPTIQYPVGVRTLKLSNGPDRPLPTTMYYPKGKAGERFPVVLFSHGLTCLPSTYQALLTRWAAAGLVVVAPAYPHTSAGVPKFDVLDVVNQPGDASYVLTQVLGLGEPWIDTAHLAAAGHSAGGITTVGLFTQRRDPRLSAGIVLAGNALGVGDAFTGPPASLLFVHGGQDAVVSYASGKAAYDHVPWAKALFTLPDQGHGVPYLSAGEPAFAAVAATTVDFLRFTLYGDPAAKARLTRDVAKAGSLDSHF